MNVPQKDLWTDSEEGPKPCDPRMTGVYCLAVAALFAASTFLIAYGMESSTIVSKRQEALNLWEGEHVRGSFSAEKAMALRRER